MQFNKFKINIEIKMAMAETMLMHRRSYGISAMYSAARGNQLEMKDMCIEFVMNVSRQGNKDKIEFENKFAEIAVLIFYEINDNTPWFCLVLSEAFS